MQRREFLLGAGVLATAATAPDLALAQEQGAIGIFTRDSLSILQGLTTETTTQLTVDVNREIKTTYLLTDVETGRKIEPLSVTEVVYKDNETRVDKLKFVGLELGHKYKFTVHEKNQRKPLDERFLSTVDLNKVGARFALMSCMFNLLNGKTEIWSSAKAADLDYLFFIGDNVYGDLWKFHGPSVLWSRYIQSRQTIPYYHWKNLKPVIAIWDDHDFGKNNVDGRYKYKETSLKMFRTFFAQDPIPGVLDAGPGVASYFRAFGQNFLFLDDRYYRGFSNPDGNVSFFGHDQIKWMSSIAGSNSNATWVLQGAPYFGRNEKGSSYQSNAPQELEFFLKQVGSWNSPAIFGSGDLHFSEISGLDKSILGYQSYELISSCMHSFTKDHFYDNPNPQVAGYLKENFLVVEQTAAQVWKTQCIGRDKKLVFETELKVG